MKLIIYGGVTAAVFVVSALVPLLFRGGETAGPESTGLSAGDRAGIFAAYWNGVGEGFQVGQIGEPKNDELERCSARMDEISLMCLVDRSSGDVRSEGSEYVSVSRGEEEIRLCRMWLEVQGDWRSWLDVCFDMDTGDVYYFYLSADCLTNPGKYLTLIPDGMDADRIAAHLSQERGYELLHLSRDGADEAVTAIYNAEGSAVCMSISCVCYTPALIDVKICCV
ncbi:MAG: hypothetical protein NC319_02570 [Butyricicoccus sp.]|nr:hypothetical protein [Butyricicoccus sp.]